MSNNDNYKAQIRPRPELIGSKVFWGWDVTLTDKSDDKTYDFQGAGVFEDADAALQDGGRSMLLWMNALAVVKDKGISEINLDATMPEPEPEAEPEVEEPAEENKPEAETVAESDAAGTETASE